MGVWFEKNDFESWSLQAVTLYLSLKSKDVLSGCWSKGEFIKACSTSLSPLFSRVSMALEMLTKQFILSIRSGAKIEEMSALKMSKVCLWKILTMLKIQQI